MLITANAQKFYNEMGKVDSSVVTTAKKMESFKLSTISLRGAFAALGGYFVARFISNIIESNVETLEFSKRIGTAAQDVSALDFAIQQTGHPIESMREGLQDLALQLAKLGRGDIVVADMFGQIGLSVKDLKDKNPAETFKLIAERISRIENPARQAGAAVRIFGKEAVHLLPLLQQGVGGIAEATQKAKNLGLLVDDSKLEKLKEGGIAISNIRRALDGIVLQLATNLAPVFGTLIELASKWVQTLSIENAFKGVEQISLNLVSWFLVSFNTIRAAFIDLRIEIIEGFEFIGQKIMRILAGLANSKMVKSFLGDFTQEFADLNGAFRQLRAENSLTVRDLKKLKVDIINDPMNTLQGVKDWFGKMNVQLAKGMKQLQGENKGINQANINEKFFEQAGKMAEQSLQPLEIFQQKIRDIQELMEKTGESKFLKRSQLEAMNQLASSLGADQTRLASSDRLGSAAAVSAYNQSRFEREVKTETPAKRLERLQKEGTASLKEIEKSSEETAKALKNFKQVTIN